MIQDTCDDLELFYESINFDLDDPLEKPSPSGTIKLKHVFPLSTEVREKQKGREEVEIIFQAATGGQKNVFKSRLLSDNRLLAMAFMKDSSDLNDVESFMKEGNIAKVSKASCNS